MRNEFPKDFIIITKDRIFMLQKWPKYVSRKKRPKYAIEYAIEYPWTAFASIHSHEFCYSVFKRKYCHILIKFPSFNICYNNICKLILK